MVQHMKWTFDDGHHDDEDHDHSVCVFMCYVFVVCLCDISMCFVSFIVPNEGNFRDKEVANKPNVTPSLK